MTAGKFVTGVKHDHDEGMYVCNKAIKLENTSQLT